MGDPFARRAGILSNTINVVRFRKAALTKLSEELGKPQSRIESLLLQEKGPIRGPITHMYEELIFPPSESKGFIVKGPIPTPYVHPPEFEYNCGDFYPELGRILKSEHSLVQLHSDHIFIETGCHEIVVDRERFKEFILWSLTAHYQLSVHELQEATPELLIALASGLQPTNKNDVDYFMISGKVHHDLLFRDIFKGSIAAQNIFFNLKQDEIEPAIETYLRRLTRGLKARSA